MLRVEGVRFGIEGLEFRANGLVIWSLGLYGYRVWGLGLDGFSSSLTSMLILH